MEIPSRLAAIRDRMESACRRAGRPPADVTLVAVTKQADCAQAQALVELDVCDLGENYPQELWRKAAALRGPVRWHLIGHLQRNKVRRTLPLVDRIHSVDSLRLLREIDQVAVEQGRPARVLLEVNVSGEASKHGLRPPELPAILEAAAVLTHARIEGLMTMAPLADDPERARPVFAALRELRERFAGQAPANVRLCDLSMGMTSDFEVAVEEGATLVRIGSALFHGLEDLQR